MHKSFKKWAWFWLFELLFKNEAFNQKSETVKFLGYGWNFFHNSSGLRKLILRTPRPYSEAHENLHFRAFSSAKRKKRAFGSTRKSDFWEDVSNASRGSKWVPNDSPSVAYCFGTDIRPTEWIWSDFTENKNYFDFFKNVCLVFKHVLCIHSSKNEHDFDFLNCFSKMNI